MKFLPTTRVRYAHDAPTRRVFSALLIVSTIIGLNIIGLPSAGHLQAAEAPALASGEHVVRPGGASVDPSRVLEAAGRSVLHALPRGGLLVEAAHGIVLRGDLARIFHLAEQAKKPAENQKENQENASANQKRLGDALPKTTARATAVSDQPAAGAGESLTTRLGSAVRALGQRLGWRGTNARATGTRSAAGDATHQTAGGDDDNRSENNAADDHGADEDEDLFHGDPIARAPAPNGNRNAPDTSANTPGGISPQGNTPDAHSPDANRKPQRRDNNSNRETNRNRNTRSERGRASANGFGLRGNRSPSEALSPSEVVASNYSADTISPTHSAGGSAAGATGQSTQADSANPSNSPPTAASVSYDTETDALRASRPTAPAPTRAQGFALPVRALNHDPDSGRDGPVRSQPVFVGNILRIEITEDGLYRLDADDLAQRGFDLTKRFHLLHRGKAVPLWAVTSGNAVGWDLAFYGAKFQSIYTKTNVYWLRQSAGKPATIDQTQPTGVGVARNTYAAVSRFEEDRRYAANLPRSTATEDHWFCMPMVFRTSRAAFSLDCAEPLSGRTATVRVMARSYSPSTVSAHVKITVNGTQVGEFTWGDARRELLTATVPANLLRDGANDVVVTGFGDTGAPLEAVYFDWLELRYDRPLKAAAGQLLFTSSGGRAQVTNLNSTDVLAVRTDGTPQRIRKLTISGGIGNTQAVFSTQASGRYAVSDITNLKIPANLESMDAPTALAKLDYLVITTDDLQAAGDLFANYHKTNSNLTTNVMTLSQVLDAGNFGIYDPAGFVNVIKQTRPTYVLLIGDMTYDYYGANSRAVDTALPAHFLVLNDFHASTDYGYSAARGVANMTAVGRIPARTYAEALVVYDKLRARAAGSPAAHSLIAVADDKHPKFRRSTEDAAAIVGGNIVRAYSGDTGLTQARRNLLAGWNAGARTVFYSGHGSPTSWASPAVFSAGDVAVLAQQDAPPIVIQLNCLASAIQLPSQSIAETLLLTAKKGASAVIGSTGFTPADGQATLGLRVLRELKLGKTVGESFRNALQVVAQTPGLAPVAESFILLGDPAGQ